MRLSLKIYLISLEQDTQRRADLAQRFPETYSKMRWIKAINGKELSAKEYFSYAQQYFKNNKKMITPSEVGCTLSHIKALEDFLKTEEKYCLILEDDVIGSDQDIILLENIVDTLPKNSLVLCGGQEGLNFDKYILGKKFKNNIFIVPKFSTKFLSRTCCYVVDQEAANNIIISHEVDLKVADHWYVIFRRSNINFLFFNLLKHPFDLHGSHIECEREYFYDKSFWKRVFQQGLLWKIFNRLRNDVLLICLLLVGYKRVRREESDE